MRKLVEGAKTEWLFGKEHKTGLHLKFTKLEAMCGAENRTFLWGREDL